MATFNVCYLGTDGVSVVSTTLLETDDLAEALILVRLDPNRPERGSFSDMQVWSDGRLIFCGDPENCEQRDSPEARCSTDSAS